MNDVIHHDEDGVVIEKVEGAGLPMIPDTAMAGALARAEIDTQVATARQYPRSIKTAIDNILTLATLDEDTATECIYALKRGGKPIRGPSIRLAEIIQQTWGNNRSGAQVVAIDRVNKIITAEGFFHDLESNSATKATVQRRISDKHGRLYNDDMIAMTGNAACSIAKRNAVLAGVPKGVWRKAQEAAERIIRGDAKTLVERRDGAIKALAHFNLSPDQVFAILDVKGLDDIDLDDLVTLRTIYTHLKSGDQTVEELLRGVKGAAPAHAVVANPLKDEDPVPKENTATPKEREIVLTAEETEEYAKTGKLRGASERYATADRIVDANGKVIKSKTTVATEGEDGSVTKTAAGTTEAQTKKDEQKLDPIAVARGRGAEARKSGALRKAMPAEYRDKDRKAEADAWLAGYDETPNGKEG